jgi:hypothetical protein
MRMSATRRCPCRAERSCATVFGPALIMWNSLICSLVRPSKIFRAGIAMPNTPDRRAELTGTSVRHALSCVPICVNLQQFSFSTSTHADEQTSAWHDVVRSNSRKHSARCRCMRCDLSSMNTRLAATAGLQLHLNTTLKELSVAVQSKAGEVTVAISELQADI